MNRCLDDAIAGAVSEHGAAKSETRDGQVDELRVLTDISITAFRVSRRGVSARRERPETGFSEVSLSIRARVEPTALPVVEAERYAEHSERTTSYPGEAARVMWREGTWSCQSEQVQSHPVLRLYDGDTLELEHAVIPAAISVSAEAIVESVVRYLLIDCTVQEVETPRRTDTKAIVPATGSSPSPDSGGHSKPT